MRETHLQLIRAKCIEANPKIVQLQLGAWVKYKKYLDSTGGKTKFYQDDYGLFGENGKTDPALVIECLGRPVRLADVLLAIGAKYGYGIWAVDETGCFWKLNSGECSIQDAFFDLRQDSLEAQSDECLLFLYEILR